MKTKTTGLFTHAYAATYDVGEDIPEKAARIDAIETQLFASDLPELTSYNEAHPRLNQALALSHEKAYLETLERTSESGEPTELATVDTRIVKETFKAAMASVSVALKAVDEVLDGRVKNAFCAIRPPGHHAGRAYAGGFCYLNNVATAALYALNFKGIKRVAIVDFDVHHGDGTEDILRDNPAVRLFSFFQFSLFPHKGVFDQATNSFNAPLAPGADGEQVRHIINETWFPKLREFQPELILISAGFDGHNEEWMAQFKLTEFDYANLTRTLKELAQELCSGRIVSVLEGGYNPRSLARCVMTHVQALINE